MVVQHFALRCLANQLFHRRLEDDGGFRHDLTLRGHGQWNPQALLQIGQSIPRKPTAVAEQRDHAGSGHVILALAYSLRSIRSERLSAQIAAQLL